MHTNHPAENLRYRSRAYPSGRFTASAATPMRAVMAHGADGSIGEKTVMKPIIMDGPGISSPYGEGERVARAALPEMILIFRGTHQVLSAEKRLKRAGVPMRLIPVPRRLTSDCGLAIRVPLAEKGRARQVLAAARILPASVHVPRADGEYDVAAF